MEQIVNPRKTQLGILVQAIEEHDQVCQITHDYSKSLKFINMLVYVATTLVLIKIHSKIIRIISSYY